MLNGSEFEGPVSDSTTGAHQRGGQMNGYSARLGTRITGPVARRLRLLVVLRRQPLNRVLTELLDKNLPSLAELTEQLNRQGSDDN